MNQPTAPVWAPQHLRLGIRAAGVALWSWNVESDRLTMDAVGYALWNVPKDLEVAFEDLSRHIHPADRDRVPRRSMRRGVSWDPMRSISGF